MNIIITPYTGKSKKTGKEFSCFKLELGDYSTLLFPVGRMERNYLCDVVGDGIKVELA